MKRIIKATTDPQISEREKRHMALAREICAEGIVLLENDGALPLKGKKLALYGYGARHTTFGGTGSGETKPRRKVNVEDGLLGAGIEVTSTAWLADFDSRYASAYEEWKTELTAALKKIPTMQHMDYAGSNQFLPPMGREITKEDVDSSQTDTALYVVTRQAGEGADRRTEKGDYLILDEELAHLSSLCGYYEHVILIINSGGVIDLAFADSLDLSAIVYLMQGGMEAGNGLADILTGTVTPSGKLTATWAERYEDFPCHDSFSYRNGNTDDEDYLEGIYVGYRWFDAWKIKPRYPFGYGLSYTDFQIDVAEVTIEGAKAFLSVEVTNIGRTHSGKEVVQVYLSAPDGKLKKERQSLAAFSKTDALPPGESQKLIVGIDLCGFPSYNGDNSEWLLEKGSYVLSVGNSSRNAKAVAILELDADAVVEKAMPVCPAQKELALIAPPPDDRVLPEVPKYAISASTIKPKLHTYADPEMARSDKVDAIISKLGVNQMIKLLVGSSYFGKVRYSVPGVAGSTTSAFIKYGIPNMPTADGPAGLNMLSKAVAPRQNFMTPPVLPEALRLGGVGRFTSFFDPKDNGKRTVYYQYCTAFPCANSVAQTWNLPLVERQGDAIGREMVEMGVVYWLGPGLNIHRNPLCGRNFEYYSEDPLLSGKMAAAVSKGVESHKGCYVTLKHYACNNQETGRNKVSSNLDERTLREIYLKGFGIAVKEGGAKGVMSSYNKVNGVYAPNSYDLLTRVLRNEWGFKGVVMTDWFGTGHGDSLDALAAKAGNDLLMPGTPLIARKIRKALKKGEVSRADIERAARNIIHAALESNLA